MDGNVIGLMDFGMVGQIDEQLREDIAEMLLAVTTQDAEHLASIIIRVGRSRRTGPRRLELDLSDFIAYFGSQSLEQLALTGLLNELIEIVRRYRIVLPARIAMLLKVLITLEGTAQLLSPRFSLLEVMRPYRRRVLRERYSPGRQVRKLRRLFWDLRHLLDVLPRGWPSWSSRSRQAGST